jgi:hypothetical protein
MGKAKFHESISLALFLVTLASVLEAQENTRDTKIYVEQQQSL